MTYHSTYIDMVNVAPEAGMVTLDMRLGTRPLGSGCAWRPAPLALRLLFVAELAVKIVQRRPHGLYRLQHDFQPLAGSFEPSRRRNGVTRLACGLKHGRRLCGGILKRRQTGALRLGWMHPRLDLSRRP